MRVFVEIRYQITHVKVDETNCEVTLTRMESTHYHVLLKKHGSQKHQQPDALW